MKRILLLFVVVIAFLVCFITCKNNVTQPEIPYTATYTSASWFDPPIPQEPVVIEDKNQLNEFYQIIERNAHINSIFDEYLDSFFINNFIVLINIPPILERQDGYYYMNGITSIEFFSEESIINIQYLHPPGGYGYIIPEITEFLYIVEINRNYCLSKIFRLNIYEVNNDI
jgi:hypothetical protein